MENNKLWSHRFFTRVTAKPKLVLLFSLLLIVWFALWIPKLQKDTRSDAFIPEDHPALIFRDQTRTLFGLEDPLVIALINEDEKGIFNPHSLYVLHWLTEQLKSLPEIDPERITALTTENNIIGTEDGMLVEPFFDIPPKSQTDADAIKTAVMDFPLYLGSLVAKDGSGTLLVAELHDPMKAQQAYEKLLAIADQAPVLANEHIHIAGEGAVSGYMGSYIDADAMRLDPIAGLVISIVCWIAFKTWRGMLLPNLVVLATAAGALGLMALFDIRFYVISNALPVVLIGISVADSIHILSEYYQRRASHPKLDSRTLTIQTMVEIWKPITFTSLTTMAGFWGLSVASVMPPMQYFGIFALVGVAIAWLYSMIVVPAVLSMLKLQSSPAYQAQQQVDIYGSLLQALGKWVLAYPRTVVLLSVLVVITGTIGAGRIELNESLIRTFAKSEPLYIADKVLNGLFDGTQYLDILLETPNSEDLFKPENLQRIDQFQTYLQTLSHVQGTTSIVDYLKQMNRALHEGRSEAYRLPDDSDLAAQYFLLYSVSGEPEDFKEEVDYDYRLANLRVRLNDSRYSVKKAVVEAAQHYLDHDFNTTAIQARLSGRVNVDYHWIKRLGDSHLQSIVISLALVWLMALLSFRSFTASILALLPVVVTILMIYAVMGFSGIWLSISTSMFAAIAIGLGVDFSIHTLERMQTLIKQKKQSIDQAILNLYPATGRALFFNFAALAFGFGVLMTSKIIILQEFGLLVAVAIATSFITSMTLLPALAKLVQPRFLIGRQPIGNTSKSLAFKR